MLKIENLSLELPDFSLKNINLEIPSGEFFAIIGPTGSGKSLLLETIMGLMPFQSGKIYLNGKDISLLSPEERGLGIVYQDCALFPHLTVKKNIGYGLKYHGIMGKEVKERVEFVVKNLNIGHLLHRYPVNLSGGEKQRVALARVLVLSPRAILLDEPLSSLDPVFQEEIRDLLKRLHQKLGITFLIVSHNFTEVLYLASSAAIVHNGEIVQRGFIDDIFNKPNSRFVAHFVGIKNVFPARAASGKVIIGDLEIYTGVSGASLNSNFVSIRPEEIVPVGENEKSYKNRIKGKVVKLTCHGFCYNVLVDVKGVLFEATWSRRDIYEHAVEPGRELTIGIRPQAVHVFKEETK